MDQKTKETTFELLNSQRIKTLDLDVHEYRHVKTGAMHYHLQAPYKENVFLVAFRTHPMDSTGVAHILEHTVLCGSEKFPVRDPFFMMIRRSLNTFMNAFTSSDYTAYPFASQNRKDFNNLLDIYLDAVFAPKLERLDFCQEGHRMEFEEADNSMTPLVYKGVVYNEMKGDTSSPVSLLYDVVKKHLFPTTTYHYNSGGDPDVIPTLSYENLLDFYKTHYHPSNAIFMTFGDIPVSELHQSFENKALSRFERLDKTLKVHPERRLAKPIAISETYSLDESDDLAEKSHLVMAWLLGTNTDLKQLMKCHLMTDLLLETSASPLRRALETGGFGTAPSPLCGLEDSNREMSFMCGLEGCRSEDAEQIEALVMKTLKNVVDSGVPQERLEAVLYQLELHQREIGGDSHPYGLQLMFSCLSAAIHRGDPVQLLNLEPAIRELREEIKQPGFVQQMVSDLLVNNSHRIRVSLVPDASLSQQMMAQEKDKLQQIKSQMSDQEKLFLIEQAKQLQVRQETADDLSLLPKVGIEDVPVEMEEPEGDIQILDNNDVVTAYRAGTNGLVYEQSIIPMPEIEDSLLSLLPVWTTILGEIGTAGRSYLHTQELQQSLCGAINASASVKQNSDGEDCVTAYVTVSTSALSYKFRQASTLLSETIHAPRFNEFPRITELIKRIRVRREAAVVRNGHALAMTAASSAWSPVLAMNHQLSGLASLDYLKGLEKSLAESKGQLELTRDLEHLHKQLLLGKRQHLLISDEGYENEASKLINEVQGKNAAGSPTESEAQAFHLDFQPQSFNQAWVTTTQVNFCASAFQTAYENHPDSPALSVLAGVLRNGFLHKELREKGGAYGGGASHDSGNGVFRFYSYRDPNLVETLSAFTASVDWLLSGKVKFPQVEESILGIISAIDSPSSPAGEARHAFHQSLHGRSFEKRRQYREAILATSAADLERVAEKYLLSKEFSQVVITSKAGASLLAAKDFEVKTL